MIITNLIQGKFVERPNRFTVGFETETGLIEIAHLRDPGRLKELLIPGAKLLLRKAPPNPKRKTKYDVIAVLNRTIWILINSGFHSDIAADLIESGLINELSNYSIQRREYTYGKSRIDFLLTNQEKTKIPIIPKPIISKLRPCNQVQNKPFRFSSLESTCKSSMVPIAHATSTDMTVTVRL